LRRQQQQQQQKTCQVPEAELISSLNFFSAERQRDTRELRELRDLRELRELRERERERERERGKQKLPIEFAVQMISLRSSHDAIPQLHVQVSRRH